MPRESNSNQTLDVASLVSPPSYEITSAQMSQLEIASTRSRIADTAFGCSSAATLGFWVYLVNAGQCSLVGGIGLHVSMLCCCIFGVGSRRSSEQTEEVLSEVRNNPALSS